MNNESVFDVIIDDVPIGTITATALNPKRKRTLPPIPERGSYQNSPWYQPGASPSASTSRGIPSPCMNFIEICASRTTTPELILLSAPSSGIRSESPLASTSVVSQHQPDSPCSSAELCGFTTRSSVIYRPEVPSSILPSTRRPRSMRPLRDWELENIVNYGSEEDSDENDDDDSFPPPLIPRVARPYLQYIDGEEEVATTMPLPSHQLPLFPTLTSSSSLPACSTTSPPPLSDLQSYRPQDKWEFEWQDFPQQPEAPTMRREIFDDRNCGPQTSFQSSYEAFTAIWSLEMMEHIARETNKYAQEVATIMLDTGAMLPNSRITSWRDTTVDELYVFFAVILATGIAVKSRLEEYWCKKGDIFCTPGFSCALSIDRFILLSKCLHFQDNASINQDNMTRSQAKLFKIQPIIEHLNNKFSSLYKMRQNIAIDESLTQWKGWLDINQFIHNKAATVGIKTIEICESQTGYLWRFEVYAGHDHSASQREETPLSGIIPSLVLRLLDGLENQGFTVWMDNYYNSPVLARELKTKGFDCVGTLRTNRQFVPASLSRVKQQDMMIGQIVGCTSGDVDLMVWRDKNRVALLSTYHGLATWECNDVRKPTIIHDYNICMGGVDRKDQMLAMYPIERKRTRIWYKKLFRRLLNVSTLNAYILYKFHYPNVTHREFRKELINQLLSKHLPAYTPAPPPPLLVPTTAHHFPAEYPHHRTAGDKKSEPLRRVCKYCKKRSKTYCEGCNVSLCLFECFKQYHITNTH